MLGCSGVAPLGNENARSMHRLRTRGKIQLHNIGIVEKATPEVLEVRADQDREEQLCNE